MLTGAASERCRNFPYDPRYLLRVEPNSIIKAPFLGWLDDDVRNFFEQALVAVHVGIRKARNTFPRVVWKIACRIMKTIPLIGSFEEYLYATVGHHVGMNQLSAVVESQVAIHRGSTPNTQMGPTNR